MAFFEGLRAAVGRYAAGVHFLARPAAESALQALATRGEGPFPVEYREFLRSFNGATLFHEAQVLFAAEEIQRVPDSPPDRRLWHIGETADGALWLDGEGRILLADEGAPDPIVAGSRIETFIDATLAREALVVDRDGEFREVFTEDELSLSVRKKRARQGLRLDPGSALYLLESAEIAYEEEDDATAQSELKRAVAIDPQAGPAWELLAALYQAAGQLSGAEHAALQAAAATWHGPLRAGRLMQAARACPERASEHARAAWAADGELAERMLSEAQQHLEAGELAEARFLSEQVKLLLSAQPRPDAVARETTRKLDELERNVRTRSALHVLG